MTVGAEQSASSATELGAVRQHELLRRQMNGLMCGRM